MVLVTVLIWPTPAVQTRLPLVPPMGIVDVQWSRHLPSRRLGGAVSANSKGEQQ